MKSTTVGDPVLNPGGESKRASEGKKARERGPGPFCTPVEAWLLLPGRYTAGNQDAAGRLVIRRGSRAFLG